MAAQLESSTIETLEPSGVWRFFRKLSEVPRPSKREGRVRDHVLAVAKEHGLAARTDEVGNVIIEVPATAGCENAPITVLQGHLDMVGEKAAHSTHDFERDPIRLLLDRTADGAAYVRADGTTLGADNGIGVALALAAATAPQVVHGPLELLFTVDEESGMTGAKALHAASLRGRRLLNLDSEDDDALYIGCAGGSDVTLSWRFAAVARCPDCECCHVQVSGLRGGHSGGDIHEGRATAVKLLARTLLRLNGDGLRIASIRGGGLRNAIPRDAEAVVCGPQGTLFDLEEAATRTRQEATGESGEPSVSIHVEPAHHLEPACTLSPEDSRRFLLALSALPHGVLGMHPKVPTLVETSNNVASVQTDSTARDGAIQVHVAALARSSSTSRMEEVLNQIRAVGVLAGATVSVGNQYPGWNPDPDSATLGVCRRVYRDLFGKEPKVLAIHAGLECGLIGERVGGMDMVSFGPRITGAHSPEERVYVDSVARMWTYLKAVLAELTEG